MKSITAKCSPAMSAGIAALAVLGMAILPGCGKTPFPTAPVQGKATYQGQPVTGGTITLRPIASGATSGNLGKPASGDVQSDGSFVLGTHGPADGAVVGKHEVRYAAPAVAFRGELKPGESLPASPFDGLEPKHKEIEVQAGKNEIHVELVRAGGATNAAAQ